MKLLRTAVAAIAATAALTLGLAAPAQAANVEWVDCVNSNIHKGCDTYTGAAWYYSGYAGMSATDDGGWRVAVEPSGGFTLYLRVWPDSSRYIDYPASQNGRVLYYDIYAVQIVVSGHEVSQRMFV